MFKYFSKLQGWNRTTSRTLIRQPSSLNLFKLIKCTTDAGTFQSFELIVATYMHTIIRRYCIHIAVARLGNGRCRTRTCDRTVMSRLL